MQKHSNEIVFICLGIAACLILSLLVLSGISRLTQASYIGLIKVNGLIVEDREIIKQLHQISEQPQVKALVLYINTPGGTLASAQSISREIQKIRHDGKPVVVSMADVCASGGYYIACAADRIFANPGTITGSIGVILRYPEAGQLLNKLGLRMEVVKSGDYKDLGDFSRKLNSGERQVLQTMIDDLHQQFVEMVLDTRGDKLAQTVALDKKIALTDLPPENVKNYINGLADGRVFTGRQALQFGLIDKLGNLDDAVQTASTLAKIKGTPKVLQPSGPSWFELMMQSTQGRNGILGLLFGLFGLNNGSHLEHGWQIE